MGEVTSSRYIVQAGWDHVPHLDEKTKTELLDSVPPHLRDARSKGEPSLGSGAIYPIPISDIEVKPFAIPFGWKKGYALDVGWNRTGRSPDGLHTLPVAHMGQGRIAASATSQGRRFRHGKR
jgi:hypothetical protein